MYALEFALTLALVAAPSSGLDPAPAQGPTQEDLRAKYQKKLGDDFVKAGGWTVDYDAARERAAKEKKYLFTYFTRTYSP